MDGIWKKCGYGLIALAFAAALAWVATPAWAADPGLLSESGTEIAAADAKEIVLDTSGAKPSWNTDGASTSMEAGTEYSIIYPNSLTYGGKTLSVKVTAKLVTDGRLNADGNVRKWVVTSKLNSEGKNETGYPRYKEVSSSDYGKTDAELTAMVEYQNPLADEADLSAITYSVSTDVSKVQVSKQASDHAVGPDRLAISWTLAAGTVVEWTIGTYSDAACTSEYGTVLLTGIQDPDESDYLIADIASRDIFYVAADYSGTVDTPPAFGDSFEVTSDGIYPIPYDSSTGTTKVDDEGNPTHGATGFDDGLILMTLNGKATVTLDTKTYSGGYLAVPFFYSPIYKVTYELDGGENDPDNPSSYLPGESHKIKDPTKKGYKFIGWKEGDEITETDTGNKTFTAQWDPIYTITYDANGGTGTMEDQEFYGSDKTKTSKDNEFTNGGKSFMGFKAYITDPDTGEETVITDENGDPILFQSATDMAKYFEGKPGGTSIRMEAQWGIKVTYRDPDTGEIYQEDVIDEDGEEPEPPEDPTRDGYIFKGWNRTVDEDGNIVYEAIWEKIPADPEPTPVPKATKKPTPPASPVQGTPNTGDSTDTAALMLVGMAALGAAALARRRFA